jgi:predicted Zn-dependent protease
MIKNMRQMQIYWKYNQQVRDNLKVVVTDPELSGYWHLGLAQQAENEAAAKKQIALARNSFEKAIGLEPNNSFATAMLAAVLVQQQDTKQATQLLYQFLEGKDSKAVGTDLRIMLGDLLYKADKKDEALKQYNKGAEEAGFDVSAHQQIMAKYKEIGKDDLADEQQKWIKDYEEKKRIYEAQQRGSEKQAPAQPAPQGGE